MTPNPQRKCPTCGGEKVVTAPCPEPERYGPNTSCGVKHVIVCPTCHGTGQLPPDGEKVKANGWQHGQEGTHYVCDERLRRLGGQATCCGCEGHKCSDAEPAAEVEQVDIEPDIVDQTTEHSAQSSTDSTKTYPTGELEERQYLDAYAVAANITVDWDNSQSSRTLEAGAQAILALIRSREDQARAEGDKLLAEVMEPFMQSGPADECRYDYRGYCQRHYLHKNPCPFGRARAYLAQLQPTSNKSEEGRG